MIKHPDYNHHHKQNDIALIRMKRRVFFTQEVRPACINTDEHLEWDYAVATGFGAKSNCKWSFQILSRFFISISLLSFDAHLFTDDRVGTNRLMRVSLNRIENRICNKYFKVSYFLWKTKHRSLIMILLYFTEDTRFDRCTDMRWRLNRRQRYM